MKQKFLVAIHGSYFCRNFGDTLLIRMMCDRVSEQVGRENVYLAVKANDAEQREIGYPVLPKEKRTEVTHLIFSGGGYFGEPNDNVVRKIKWGLRNYKRHFSWLSTFGCAKIAIIGVGVGPITNIFYRRAVRRLINNAEIRLVRDKESIYFAKKHGASDVNLGLCVDMALMVPKSERPRSSVGLHIGNLKASKIKLVISALFSKYGAEVEYHVIKDSPGVISSECVDAYTEMSRQHGIELILHDYIDYHELLRDLERYELVVTSKLHVGICAIAQGARVISVPVHEKTPRLYKQLHLEEFCIPVESLGRKRLIKALDSLSCFEPNRKIIDQGLGEIDQALKGFLSKVRIVRVNGGPG